MVAAGTHTPRAGARGITIWAAALAAGGVVSPVAGGWLARFSCSGAPYASWRWAFLLVGVLALMSAVVTWALDHAYNLGYLICGISAGVAAAPAIVVLRGRARHGTH